EHGDAAQRRDVDHDRRQPRRPKGGGRIAGRRKASSTARWNVACAPPITWSATPRKRSSPPVTTANATSRPISSFVSRQTVAQNGPRRKFMPGLLEGRAAGAEGWRCARL